MRHNNLLQNKGLVNQPNLAKWLDLTRSGLDKLRKKDPTFPRPIKDGEHTQASVYYVMAEVEAWLSAKIAARDAA